jgi:hypothetical protein
MSVEIDVIVENEYVCLRCTGVCSLADVKKLYSKAVDAAMEHKRPRVLIDVDGITGDLRAMERYESSVFLARDILQRALGKITKIAVCGKEPPLDPQRFGETVAKNRGVNAKAFTNCDEAIEWINL